MAFGFAVMQCARSWIAFALAVLCTTAQSEPIEATGNVDSAAGVTTPDVRVTAYRIPLLLDDSTQSVSIVSRSEILQRNPASTPELLEVLPGVHIDRVGAPGGKTNLYVRGSEPNHVLVLIDGVRVNDPTDNRGGSYDLSSIDVSSVERIEVLRGAHSAAFGADAMGGIVNIVTRRSEGKGFHARGGLGAGGQAYRRAYGRLSAAGDLADIEAGASHLEDGRRRDGGRLILDTIDGSARLRLGNRVQLRFYARDSERDSSSFPEFSGGVRLAQNRALEERTVLETLYQTDGTWSVSKDVELSLRLSHSTARERRDTPEVLPGPGGFVPASESTSDFERNVASLAAAVANLPGRSSLALGIEYWREEGEAESVTFIGFPLTGRYELERDTLSQFGRYDIALTDAVKLNFGLRRDDVDPGQSLWSRSAGARLRLTNTTQLKVNWSGGFKPPSFYALGDPLVGNPALEAETSEAGEIGLVQTFWNERVTVEATAFSTRYKNLIDFDPDAFMLVNRNKVLARGTEVQVVYRPSDSWSLRANYSYVDHDTENGVVLRNRPRHRASAVATYRFNSAWSASGSAVYVGTSHDSSIPTGDVRLPAYTRFDARLRYEHGPASIALALDNVFDTDYESFVGFEAPGRRVRLTLRWAI